jgi:hypothetical protein
MSIFILLASAQMIEEPKNIATAVSKIGFRPH